MENHTSEQLESNILFAILSLIIVISIIIIVKIVEYTKFKTLSGSYKATGVIFIILGTAEVMYLAITLKLLTPAIEIVTSLSVILLFFTFVCLNKLQNAISGMSIALGTRMSVGDFLEFDGKKGIIAQIGLTKTIVDLEESGEQMMIPNKKIDEEIAVIQKKNAHQNNNSQK